MKIDPHASLLAAQQLRSRANTERAREAQASFFAEVKKAGASSINAQQDASKRTSTTGQKTPLDSVQAKAATKTREEPGIAATNTLPLKEAPLRSQRPDRPMPPGSLLNILV